MLSETSASLASVRVPDALGDEREQDARLTVLPLLVLGLDERRRAHQFVEFIGRHMGTDAAKPAGDCGFDFVIFVGLGFPRETNERKARTYEESERRMLCSCWLVYGRATGDRLKRRRH